MFYNIKLFGDVYRNKRVLVTGHTGFKGSWLCLWLNTLGAEVLGYALPPNTEPNHSLLLREHLTIKSVMGDICDLKKLRQTFETFKPEIVFHLAAQPLVRLSYSLPLETFHTNIIGTANVIEAVRSAGTVRVFINVTSDKCYENREWYWKYRENDPVGGYDPYSASKGCSELVTSSYRSSFFNPSLYGIEHRTLIASVRAGNVIGGGDWAEDRIVSDMMKAAYQNTPVKIRNPKSIRPWQHVLEPLSGYLLLGQQLFKGRTELAGAFNFGPKDEQSYSVVDMVKLMSSHWRKIQYNIEQNPKDLHEANLLRLDCSKAQTLLKWEDVWNYNITCETTVDWYKQYYEAGQIETVMQIQRYVSDAKKANICWTS